MWKYMKNIRNITSDSGWTLLCIYMMGIKIDRHLQDEDRGNMTSLTGEMRECRTNSEVTTSQACLHAYLISDNRLLLSFRKETATISQCHVRLLPGKQQSNTFYSYRQGEMPLESDTKHTIYSIRNCISVNPVILMFSWPPSLALWKLTWFIVQRAEVS